MSLLNTINVKKAEGKVKEIYEEIEKSFGMIPNGIQLWSLNPRLLENQWNNIKETMAMDLDKQKLQTIIRFLVAEQDNCEYCIGFNKGMLINMYGFTNDEVNMIKNDPSTASLEEKNVALLIYALKTANDAHNSNKDDISKLEQLGCTHEEIFDCVYSVSYMKVVTTLFEAFKVEIDH